MKHKHKHTPITPSEPKWMEDETTKPVRAPFLGGRTNLEYAHQQLRKSRRLAFGAIILALVGSMLAALSLILNWFGHR